MNYSYKDAIQKRGEKKGYTASGKTRISVPLDNEIYLLLKNEAELRNTFPQTVAKQIITKWIKEEYNKQNNHIKID